MNRERIASEHGWRERKGLAMNEETDFKGCAGKPRAAGSTAVGDFLRVASPSNEWLNRLDGRKA